MSAPRVLLAAGGTGGHFYPGYVLGRALRACGLETLYLVREDDPAEKTLAADDQPFVEVPLRGLPRRLSFELPRFFWRLARSVRLLDRVIADFGPRVVVGMGGYLTFPAAWAARRRGIPVLLHEANATLGLANRASLGAARRLALGLPFERPPHASFLLAGTPVRPELWKLPEPEAAKEALGLDAGTPAVLVFGGSQGARGLNHLAPQALRRLATASTAPFQVLHLAGAAEAESVRRRYEGAAFKALVLPYLHQMERAYAAAELVLCRSGASTLAELGAVRRPALLVPFPFAAANHQEANAKAAARAGAARWVAERGLTPERLAEALRDLIPSGTADAATRARLLDMGRRWARLGLPRPSECVAGLVGAVRELAELP